MIEDGSKSNLAKFLNVISNISYGLVSVIPFSEGSLEGIIAGSTLVVLMIGSSAFHYYEKKGHWGHRLDEISMYAVLMTTFIFGLHMLDQPTIPIVVLCVLSLLVMSFSLDKLSSTTVIPILAMPILLILWVATGVESLIAVMLIIIAFIVRQSSKNHKSFGYLHSIWHIISSVGLGLTHWLFINPQ